MNKRCPDRFSGSVSPYVSEINGNEGRLVPQSMTVGWQS